MAALRRALVAGFVKKGKDLQGTGLGALLVAIEQFQQKMDCAGKVDFSLFFSAMLVSTQSHS